MAAIHLMDYEGFQIVEDKPWEGYTKFPICFKYHGRIIDWCVTVEEAQRAIDAMPRWLADRMREIDMHNELEARARGERN